MYQVAFRRGLWTTACCAALWAASPTAPAAAAQASAGCAAANGGALNMRAAAGTNHTRQVTLSEGERLTLFLSTPGTAAVTVSGPESGAETLHSGRTASLSFVAKSSASYGFRLDADAEESASLSITCMSVARGSAERALADRRRAFLSSRESDRTRIDRPKAEAKPIESYTASETGGALPREASMSISLSELAAAMKMGDQTIPTIMDFWVEGTHQTYDTVDLDSRHNDGNFSTVSFGGHYMLGPDIMLGYLTQFDQLGEYSRYSGSLSRQGWMTGPYMSVRFGHGVIFDGRAAWGNAELPPNGVMLDTVPADRMMMRGKLRGTRQVGAWTLSPSVGMSYVEDTPKYREAAFSEATTVGTGRLDVVPEMKRRFDLDSSTYIEPRIAAGGFLSFDDISRLAPGGVNVSDPDLHWKAEAGVAVGVKDSMTLQATGGVETGGQTTNDNWLGKLQLSVPLGQ